MNLIEKLIEAEIEKCKDVLRIYHEPENSNPAQVFIDASDHLTDLRNALQEYREMCGLLKTITDSIPTRKLSKENIAERALKAAAFVAGFTDEIKMTEHPLKELKNPKNPD